MEDPGLLFTIRIFFFYASSLYDEQDEFYMFYKYQWSFTFFPFVIVLFVILYFLFYYIAEISMRF
jgi:hypothetical protein